MLDRKMPPAPKGLGATGRRLWRAVLTDYELDQHEVLLLIEACRVADRLDRLAEESDGAPLTTMNHRGDEVADPRLVEARQQAIVYARLVAALRLPVEAEGVRPQRRGAPRGAYGVTRRGPWSA